MLYASSHRFLSLRRCLSVRALSRITSPALFVGETCHNSENGSASIPPIVAAAALLLTAATSMTISVSSCEAEQFTPSSVAKEDFEQIQHTTAEVDKMPVYTADQVALNNGQDGRPIWMTYGGIVYDVTEFIANHPGGSEKIIMAAGSAIEPFWHLYRQHYASDLPMRLMEHMMIGRLDEKDQSAIDEQMEILTEQEQDPYHNEPIRHSALYVHSDTPMNAEVPAHLLNKQYLTPNSLFYIRHHHPVPSVQDRDWSLNLDLHDNTFLKFTLEELKAMPKTDVVVTLQCSGNRRSGFNEYKRTSGTPWSQGAISTAKFTGVRLRDVLKKAGINIDELQENDGVHHVRFISLDGMESSIPIEKVINPYGDVILAYEMNDETLPRDHGYPLRVIVPGYAAVRNVKWLQSIQLSETEAEGPWQRGLNYKILPPSVTDAKDINLDTMPGIMEVSLFSGITRVDRSESVEQEKKKEQSLPEGVVLVNVSGWAWAGGGRNIVRVDVTADEGKTWSTATLKEGSEQRFGRAWAWTFWECTLPAKLQADGTVQLASKAVDMAFNTQPESSDHMWNVRGLGNNSWYRTQVKVL